MASKARGLGRGLDALFQDASVDANVNEPKDVEVSENSIVYVGINEIKPNVNQPRKTFDPEKIKDLADSIMEHGLIQPIVVRKLDKGYEIVAGERR